MTKKTKLPHAPPIKLEPTHEFAQLAGRHEQLFAKLSKVEEAIEKALPMPEGYGICVFDCGKWQAVMTPDGLCRRQGHARIVNTKRWCADL
jgi:hypothetical protein